MNIHVPFPLCSLWVGMLTEPVVHLSPLSSSGSGAAHAEPPSSLHSGAGAGQRYTAVYGQRGLPLGLDAWLEGGGQRRVWGGVR